MAIERILAIYDILGIQDFIFSANKLKENLGGSIIVQETFENDLCEIIIDNCNNPLINIQNSDIDWEKNSHDAVVVYYRGGNALVIFNDIETAKLITEKLALKVLNNSGGLLNFMVAYYPSKLKNFQDDFRKLMLDLKNKKNSHILTTPLLGIGITKTDLSSGLPAFKIYERDFISKPSLLKRKKAEKQLKTDGKKRYYDFLLKNIKAEYDFPLDLDDLGQKIGEKYVAIVHIDGDNMGQKIQTFLDKTHDNYNETIYRMSMLSRKIDDLYRTVMRKVVEDVAKILKDDKFRKMFEIKKIKDTDKEFLPIRPIILNGDDITFVCNGKIGINLAEIFLKKLAKSELRISGEIIEHSASAGVVIVKSHFPFDKAYTIVEELCKSAKIKGKILQEQHEEERKRGFWLDFHVIQSGLTSDLSETRKNQYNLSDIPHPDKLVSPTSQIHYQQYNLLWRPWLIIGENHLNRYNWSHLKSLLYEFNSSKEDWPKSKLKKLHQLLTISKDKVDGFLLRMESRDIKLPNFLNDNIIFYNGQTPYCDALEIMDYYYIEMKELLK